MPKTNLQSNLARLKALSHKLAVMKHWVDCMITRLENRKHYEYLSHDEFRYEYVRPMDRKFDDLVYVVRGAMHELKG